MAENGSCYQLDEEQVKILQDETGSDELRQVIRRQKALGQTLGQPIDEYGRAIDDDGRLLNGDGRWRNRYSNNINCWSSMIQKMKALVNNKLFSRTRAVRNNCI
jgi:hypothetical protein